MLPCWTGLIEMTKRRIHVANLMVRMPHGMAADAENVAAGIGNTLMRRIAESAMGKTGSFRIDKISAGRFSSSIGAGDVQKQVGTNAANAVANKIGGGGR